MVITGVAQQSPLTVVTDPKIRQPMPASDGADYLKTIPGFSAVRNGGVNGDPVFRGMFGSRLKLLSMAVKCSAPAPTAWIRRVLYQPGYLRQADRHQGPADRTLGPWCLGGDGAVRARAGAVQRARLPHQRQPADRLQQPALPPGRRCWQQSGLCTADGQQFRPTTTPITATSRCRRESGTPMSPWAGRQGTRGFTAGRGDGFACRARHGRSQFASAPACVSRRLARPSMAWRHRSTTTTPITSWTATAARVG